MARKVWVIAAPQGSTPASASSASVRRPSSGSIRMPAAAAPGSPSSESSVRSGRRIDVLTAYLLGPVSSALWLRGPGRYAWNAAGTLSTIAVLVLMLRGDAASSLLGARTLGAGPWLAVFTASVLTMFTVWSRAVGAAGRRAPSFPSQVRAPWVVGALGLLVPGLGHQVIGRSRRAALAFWLLGPLVASVAVLASWRRLWFLNLAASAPALSSAWLEAVLAAAALLAAAASAVWISEAVDGARRASPSRVATRTDAAGVALLGAIALFAVTFRPDAAAHCLDGAANRLSTAGFRLLPLAAAEAAARLDPSEPRHLARALELDEALGLEGAALEKREILEERTRAHLEVVWAEGHGLRRAAPPAAAPDRAPDAEADLQASLR